MWVCVCGHVSEGVCVAICLCAHLCVCLCLRASVWLSVGVYAGVCGAVCRSLWAHQFCGHLCGCLWTCLCGCLGHAYVQVGSCGASPAVGMGLCGAACGRLGLRPRGFAGSGVVARPAARPGMVRGAGRASAREPPAQRSALGPRLSAGGGGTGQLRTHPSPRGGR